MASTTRCPTILRSTQRAIGMIGHGSRVAKPPPTWIANRRYQGRKRGILRATRSRFLRGDLEVLGAHDAVDEAERELEAARILEHAGEALGARVGLGGLRLGEPLLDEGLDLVDGGQVGERGGGGGGGHALPVCACSTH